VANTGGQPRQFTPDPLDCRQTEVEQNGRVEIARILSARSRDRGSKTLVRNWHGGADAVIQTRYRNVRRVLSLAARAMQLNIHRTPSWKSALHSISGRTILAIPPPFCSDLVFAYIFRGGGSLVS